MSRLTPQLPFLSSPRKGRRLRTRLKWYSAAGFMGLASLLLLILSLNGTLKRWTDTTATNIFQTTARAGFRIEDVIIEGRRFTSREDLMTVLNLHRGDPIFAFDPATARNALEALPRIADAQVERRLPDLISIKLTERPPMALWQHDHKTVLIDQDGVVLSDQHLQEFAKLPIMVGADAEKSAAAMLALANTEPTLAKRITAFVRVGERRWDLHLDNNIAVKLPELGADMAFHKLAQIEAEHGLLERDVIAVDLRMSDRIVVETGSPRDLKHKPAVQQGI